VLLLRRRTRDTDSVTALLCHDDVKVCRACVGWLRSQTGTLDSTAILPVRDGCYLIVRDVDAWHSQLSSAGLPVTTLSDQPWRCASSR